MPEATLMQHTTCQYHYCCTDNRCQFCQRPLAAISGFFSALTGRLDLDRMNASCTIQLEVALAVIEVALLMTLLLR